MTINMMEKIILMLIVGSLLIGSTALAITTAQTGLDATAEAAQVTVAKTVPQLVGYFINIVLGILSLVLLGVIVYGGILYMTAGGNTQTTEKARSWIINGAIGLLIAVLAFALSNFIIAQVEGLAK
jgi:hypothetical protein